MMQPPNGQPQTSKATSKAALGSPPPWSGAVPAPPPFKETEWNPAQNGAQNGFSAAPAQNGQIEALEARNQSLQRELAEARSGKEAAEQMRQRADMASAKAAQLEQELNNLRQSNQQQQNGMHNQEVSQLKQEIARLQQQGHQQSQFQQNMQADNARLKQMEHQSLKHFAASLRAALAEILKAASHNLEAAQVVVSKAHGALGGDGGAGNNGEHSAQELHTNGSDEPALKKPRLSASD